MELVRAEWRDIGPLMQPGRVAVVGVSEKPARGNRVVRNLLQLGFQGDVYPINPKYAELQGIPCYPDLASTPQPADAVVVAIPAAGVLAVLATAVDQGVRAAVVLSSGFGEAGPEGRQRQGELERLGRERGLLLCGPNCYGVFNLNTMSALYSAGELPSPLRVGDVALVSQSGGSTGRIANPLMEQRGVGFSYLVSCGNQAGVTVEEYINFFVEDASTRVIAAFVEGFRRPELLRAVAAKARDRGKPIIVFALGRSEASRRATLAHTGSLAGSGQVLAAALRQLGIIQVLSVNELIETVSLFASPMAHRYGGGRRLAILSGSGGDCGYVSDVAHDQGVELPGLAHSTREQLRSVMPQFGTPQNPLDATGSMYEDPTLFPRLLKTLTSDPNHDLALVDLDCSAPRQGGRPTFREFGHAVADLAQRTARPLAVFSTVAGAPRDLEAVLGLRQAGVPFLDGAENTLRAVCHLDWYHQVQAAQSGLLMTDHPPEPTPPPAAMADLPSGLLNSDQAFRLLAASGIPVAPWAVARTGAEAAAAATRIGFPVALKVESTAIAHKSDVGGVILGLTSPAAVEEAYRRLTVQVAERLPGTAIAGVLVQTMAPAGTEIILGVNQDAVFGPAIVCGLGGIFVEILQDAVVALPPLSPAEAESMLRRLRGWPLLAGARGRPPADVAALSAAIAALSRLATALAGRMAALDINPMLVFPDGQGVLAVDALVHLR